MEIFNNVHLMTKNYNTEISKNKEIQGSNEIEKNSKDDFFKNKSKEEVEKELQKVIEELNKAMAPLNKDLKFQFNNKVDELVVQVVDEKHNQVIREFPPKEALKLMEKMRELVGILFNEKG